MRPQNSRLLREVRNYCALIPDVISGCQDVDISLEKFVGNLRSNSKPPCRIFNVGDAEIDPMHLHQTLELVKERFPARFPKNVADE